MIKVFALLLFFFSHFSSCKTRIDRPKETKLPSSSSSLDSSASSLKALNLLKQNPQNLNPDHVFILDTPVESDNVALIHTPLIDIDFIKWKACDDSGNCKKGWSNRPQTFLVSLPEGRYDIQVQLCLREDHSTTGQEECSRWKDSVSYTQKKRRNLELSKWMLQKEIITQRFNDLGLELHSHMQGFLLQAEQCSDRDPGTISTMRAALTRGPDTFAYNLSQIGSPLLLGGQSKPALFATSDNLDETVEQLGEIQTEIEKKEAEIRELTSTMEENARLQAQYQSELDELQTNIQKSEEQLGKTKENISELSKKLEGVDEDKVFPAHQNKNDLAAELSRIESFYDGNRKGEGEGAWARDADIKEGGWTGLKPERIKYLRLLSPENIFNNWNSTPNRLKDIELAEGKLSKLRKRKGELETNWKKYGGITETYETSREKKIFDRIERIEKNLEGFVNRQKIYLKREEIKAQKIIENKIEAQRAKTSELKAKIAESQAKQTEVSTKTQELQSLLSQREALRAQKLEVEVKLPRTPLALSFDAPTVTSVVETVPAETRLSHLSQSQSSERLLATYNALQNSLLDVESRLQRNQPFKSTYFFEGIGILDFELDTQGKPHLAVILLDKTVNTSQMLTQEEASKALVPVNSVEGKDVELKTGLLANAIPGAKIKSTDFATPQGTFQKVNIQDPRDMFKLFQFLKDMTPMQMANVFPASPAAIAFLEEQQRVNIPEPKAITFEAKTRTSAPEISSLGTPTSEIQNPSRPLAEAKPTQAPAPKDKGKVKAPRKRTPPPTRTPPPPPSSATASPPPPPKVRVARPPVQELPAQTLQQTNKIRPTFTREDKILMGALGAGGLGAGGAIAAIVLAATLPKEEELKLNGSCFGERLKVFQKDLGDIHDRALKLYHTQDIVDFMILDQLGTVRALLDENS